VEYREGDEILRLKDCWDEELIVAVSVCSEDSRLVFNGSLPRFCLDQGKWESLKKEVDLYFSPTDN